ncbi:FMN-linked oxidoreductase [Rhizodiscina lignyota]|uniref:FMN-linked oxidoreductase n=1 Tax=Rhizodiscina lignyota TaxID=1504668 RepID=A0A9P4I860_9PEZI|nr:FMN-linked oxidoreductase [Rhizodiscina lignyota]
MPKISDPLRIGNCQLEHRIVMAPLTRLRSDEEHIPLPMVTEYYAQRASVPGTMLITEATFVSFRHSGRDANAPGIYTKEQIAEWKQITDAVHARGSFIWLQIWALGRAARAHALAAKGLEMISSSATPLTPESPVPRPMTEEEIWQCIGDFGSAAKNAVEAGFDGVEVHGANGYMIDQFTQDNCNKRTDAWGGSVEKRARFCIEVTKSCIEAIGVDRVGVRLAPWNTFQGMRMADPIPQFTYLIKELTKLKPAFLHLVESRVAGNYDIEASETLQFAVDAWGHTNPLLVAGGYKPDTAQKALETEYKDYDVAIVFGRFFISNPDLPYRILHGLPIAHYNRDTFYTAKSTEGYTDYPFIEGFKVPTIKA